jgi:hypothetical protein
MGAGCSSLWLFAVTAELDGGTFCEDEHASSCHVGDRRYAFRKLLVSRSGQAPCRSRTTWALRRPGPRGGLALCRAAPDGTALPRSLSSAEARRAHTTVVIRLDG